MKKLDFCKPTKSVTGAWITFGLTKDQDEDKKNGFYVNMIRQAGWNDETRNGTFKENVNNLDSKVQEQNRIIQSIFASKRWKLISRVLKLFGR